MPSLYNCKHATDAYRITKFTSDLEVESSYLCTVSTCECPAGHRPKCRHREMLPKFIQRGMVDANWFFDYDRGGWVEGWQEPEPSPELTAEEIEELPDGVEKDFQHTMQEAESSVLDTDKIMQMPSDLSDEYLRGIMNHEEPSPELPYEDEDQGEDVLGLTPAGLGQASDPKSDLQRWADIISGRFAESIKEQPTPAPQPSPSPTIRRRV